MLTRALIAFLLTLTLGGCGYNTLQQRDESVKAAWSQILALYQKRHDLVPNLVAVVQGYAGHEKEVFTGVAQARAAAGTVKLREGATEEDLKKFAATQDSFSSALSRLLGVAENYPTLKADGNFRDLQRQLVTLEDQIGAARRRYIREVRDYNIVVRSFPTNLTAMAFGHQIKPNFAVENEQQLRAAPAVSFGK